MFDVLIVGAGLSGLTTAYKLLQKEPSIRIKMLEATDDIGGQMNSFKCDPELGGKLFKADQTHMHKLLSDLGVQMRKPTPISKNLKRSWDLDEGPFAYIAKFELKRYMSHLDLRSQLYWPGAYELTPENKRYSMYDHITSNLFFSSSRRFMLNFVRLVTGVDAKDISLVEFMSTLHSCGNLTTLMELYIKPTQNVLEFSAEQLLTALECRLDSVLILRRTQVIEIRHHEDCVEVIEADGTFHPAKVVVLAIPNNHLEDIYISPPIPKEWEIRCSGDKYCITSFRANYDEPHWRHRGYSGSFYCEKPAIYAHQNKTTSLIGCILHDQDCEMCRCLVLKSLAKKFGKEMREPVEYSQQTFEQASLLSLPCTTPWNRIIWSSTSSATVDRGSLNGAVQSGMSAAIHALLLLRPQSIAWQDLAETQKLSIIRKYPSHWDLLMSSINVYNTAFYTTLGITVYLFIKNKQRIFSFSNLTWFSGE